MIITQKYIKSFVISYLECGYDPRRHVQCCLAKDDLCRWIYCLHSVCTLLLQGSGTLCMQGGVTILLPLLHDYRASCKQRPVGSEVAHTHVQIHQRP